MNISQEQAQAYVNQLNAFQPYVPPMHFATVAGSPVSAVLVGIAQGQLNCEVTGVVPPPASPPKLAVVPKSKG